ncbi:hypothetical protein JavanS729_0014 [Streptococcus satellite phage Javan729]|nr:hypothetical protein JavanS729_0014 [Streptococcus satellite phage Javan729]
MRLAITRKKLYKKQLKKTHAQKFGDREHEACDRKNCIRNNHSKSPHSNFGRGECEDILDSKRQKKETNMTITLEMISEKIEDFCDKLESIAEKESNPRLQDKLFNIVSDLFRLSLQVLSEDNRQKEQEQLSNYDVFLTKNITELAKEFDLHEQATARILKTKTPTPFLDMVKDEMEKHGYHDEQGNKINIVAVSIYITRLVKNDFFKIRKNEPSVLRGVINDCNKINQENRDEMTSIKTLNRRIGGGAYE